MPERLSPSVPDEERDRNLRNYEMFWRGCKPYVAYREWNHLPPVTEQELVEGKEVLIQEALDGFWLNDKE